MIIIVMVYNPTSQTIPVPSAMAFCNLQGTSKGHDPILFIVTTTHKTYLGKLAVPAPGNLNLMHSWLYSPPLTTTHYPDWFETTHYLDSAMTTHYLASSVFIQVLSSSATLVHFYTLSIYAMFSQFLGYSYILIILVIDQKN